LSVGTNKSYEIFKNLSTKDFNEFMDIFFKEDEKKFLLDIFQAIIELEKVDIAKISIDPTDTFKSVQKLLHMKDEEFKEWVLCIRAIKIDSWRTNIQEFQNQLYYMIFQVVLAEVNKFLEKDSEMLEENMKSLSLVNIWNLKNNEVKTSWNDFFVNYSNDFWKINVFNVSKQELYLQGIKNENLSTFINLVDVIKF
jgi:hypothetical protein